MNKSEREEVIGVKWIFNRGTTKSQLKGLVGVHETPDNLSVAYGAPNESNKMVIKAFTSQAASNREAKQTIIKRFVMEHQLQGLPSCYVLSANEYSLNLVDAPAVKTDEIPLALRWVLRDLVSFPIEEAIIDTFELPFPRARDNAKMLYAVAIRKTIIPTIESLIEGSGLVLKYIDIPELVLRNILNQDPRYLNGGAFIQLNAHGGKLILCKNLQICMTRSFEQKLEELLETSTGNTEKALESFELEIQRSFDYLNSVFRQSISNALLLSALGMKQELIQKALKSALGAEVNFLKLSEILTLEQPMTELEEVQCLLAIGAAIREEEKIA